MVRSGRGVHNYLFYARILCKRNFQARGIRTLTYVGGETVRKAVVLNN